MAIFGRVLGEKVRQTVGFTGKIDPTSNDDYMKVRSRLVLRLSPPLRSLTLRSPAFLDHVKMLKSCSDFSGELKKVYLKLKDMKTVTSEFAVASKKLLQTPLPVAYEGTAAASGSNVAPIVTVGGGAFDSETMSGSNTNVGQALESEVLVPMKKWLDTFKSVEASVKAVEDLRLEVDSRRHTVADLSASVDKLVRVGLAHLFAHPSFSLAFRDRSFTACQAQHWG